MLPDLEAFDDELPFREGHLIKLRHNGRGAVSVRREWRVCGRVSASVSRPILKLIMKNIMIIFSRKMKIYCVKISPT